MTNRLAMPPWRQLGEEGTETLRRIVTGLSWLIVDAGAIDMRAFMLPRTPQDLADRAATGQAAAGAQSGRTRRGYCAGLLAAAIARARVLVVCQAMPAMASPAMAARSHPVWLAVVNASRRI